jgi:hypothetical protein
MQVEVQREVRAVFDGIGGLKAEEFRAEDGRGFTAEGEAEKDRTKFLNFPN